MQTEIELVILRFSAIEKRLVDDLGATEKNGKLRTNFATKLAEVAHFFSPEIIKRLKMLAALRNRFAHGELIYIPNKQRFNSDCEAIDCAINRAKKQKQEMATETINSASSNFAEEENERSMLVKNIAFISISFLLLLIVRFYGQEVPATNQASTRADNSNVQPKQSHLVCRINLENNTDKAITKVYAKLQILDSTGKICATFSTVEITDSDMEELRRIQSRKYGSGY